MFATQTRKTVQLNAVQQTQIEALSSVLDKLSKNDGNFASSLIQNFYRYGSLSPKQLTWVDTLQQRATQPAPVAQIQVNFQKIQDLFDVAAKKLRRVKVKLQTTQGQPVAFSRAGAASKYAGQILITDGGPFGNNKFFGRVDVTGEFFATRSATQEVCDLVKEFADDPSATAGRYGRLTGGCSFCNHGLKDDRSVQVGYGPVCARNFGLAWG